LLLYHLLFIGGRGTNNALYKITEQRIYQTLPSKMKQSTALLTSDPLNSQPMKTEICKLSTANDMIDRSIM